MKKMIITILTAVSTFAFANEPAVSKTFTDLSLDAKTLRKEAASVRRGFTYFRIAAADSYPVNSVQVVPGLGIGYRLTAGHGAVDVSANFNSSEGWGESYFWTLPKVSYVYYLNPVEDQTFYAGAGLGWGGLRAKDSRAFEGIVANATAGMEFFRSAAFRTFAELNISQPAVARAISGPFPGPVAEFSVGAGF